MKKFISLLLAVLLSFTTFAATTDFVDVNPENEVLVEAVDLLDYMGVAKGTSETTFGANELVTREQFALFVYRLMKGGKDAPANASNTTKFTDLENPTYFYAISWANAAGIVNGRTETTFAPKDPIKLKEAYAMLTRALEWEDEDVVYPYGHIEIAEQNGVNLDEGLDASLSYEDDLTRGDMAILLNNAFFAEMGIEKEENTYEWIGRENDKVLVVNKKTTHPTLCEEKFGVEEFEFQAIATPHFTTGEVEATYNLGYDAIYFKNTEVSDISETYISAEELGIDNLDDYFLGTFRVFAQVEDGEIEKVLFADCNMITTTTNDLVLGEVTSNKTDSYFDGTDAKLLSGKLSFDGVDMYVYDAPYSYAKGDYSTSSDEDKYAIRNKENLELISYVKHEDGDDYWYEAVITPITDNFEVDAEALLETFYNVYYGGLYEATVIDVNADGIYDYIDYVPYTLFQVDSDEDKYFEDSDFDETIPYIYTNEAVINDVKYSDEDYVIGYFDEANEVIYIAEVLKPVTSTVKTYKKSKGTITLANGKVLDAVSAWKYVDNYVPYSDNLIVNEEDEVAIQVENNNLFTSSVLDRDDSIDFYIYDNVILYHTATEETTKFSGSLIIPTDYKAPRVKFNEKIGEDIWYIHAYVDGVAKYVPVDTEDTYPAIISNDAVTEFYAEQLCTYTVKNGVYYIKSLAFGEDEDGNSDCIDTDIADLNSEDDVDYIVTNETDITMTKIAGSRFELSGFGKKVELQDYTNIIIRVPGDKDNEYEYFTYGKDDFKASAETVFATATYIISNNVDSNTKENLAVLYATVNEDFEFVGKTNRKAYRIVCGSSFEVDEDGDYRNLYTLINPFTGKVEYDVPSKNVAEKAKDLVDPVEVGVMIKLVDGLVDEDKDVEELGEIFWISEYEVSDNYLALVDGSLDEVEGSDETFVEVDNNTTIMVLTADSQDELFTDGVLTTIDVEDLEKPSKSLRCYNTKATDRKDNYKTIYNDYIRAYVSYDDSDLDADEVPVADYVIVVVYEDNSIVEE